MPSPSVYEFMNNLYLIMTISDASLLCQQIPSETNLNVPLCLNFICQHFGVGRYEEFFTPMKMEQTGRSKTSAYKIQKLGNYPEESLQHSEQGESLKSRNLNVSVSISFNYCLRKSQLHLMLLLSGRPVSTSSFCPKTKSIVYNNLQTLYQYMAHFQSTAP